MDIIKLQLLCGVMIKLFISSLPYLVRFPSRSLPHTTFCVKKGCYNYANPLSLRLNLRLWGLPTNGLDPWPITTTTKREDQTLKASYLLYLISNNIQLFLSKYMKKIGKNLNEKEICIWKSK